MQKKLYRVEEGKMICGVCGGLAEYFDLDQTVVRLGTVLFCCMGGGLLAYIIAALIIPVKPTAIED